MSAHQIMPIPGEPGRFRICADVDYLAPQEQVSGLGLTSFSDMQLNGWHALGAFALGWAGGYLTWAYIGRRNKGLGGLFGTPEEHRAYADMIEMILDENPNANPEKGQWWWDRAQANRQWESPNAAKFLMSEDNQALIRSSLGSKSAKRSLGEHPCASSAPPSWCGKKRRRSRR